MKRRAFIWSAAAAALAALVSRYVPPHRAGAAAVAAVPFAYPPEVPERLAIWTRTMEYFNRGGIRFGQAIGWAMHDDPELAAEVDAAGVCPAYDDGRVPAFIQWLLKRFPDPDPMAPRWAAKREWHERQREPAARQVPDRD